MFADNGFGFDLLGAEWAFHEICSFTQT